MANQDQFQIGLLQLRSSPDSRLNLKKHLEGIEEAARRGAQIICLQELFLTPYFCQVQDPDLFELAESIPGPTTDALGAVAKKCSVVVIGSLFEKRAPGVFHNTAVVLGPDGNLIGIYRKMHIPDDPLYFEKYYFTPGDLGFKVFPTPFAKIGVLICWDQWFPEGARLTALQGAEILFYPTAIGWHPKEKEAFGKMQTEAWLTMHRAHSIANGIPVAAVNRVGFEANPPQEGLEFWGNSHILGPFGNYLSHANHQNEEILVAPCSRQAMDETRRNWPFFRDRRIDYYSDLNKRWK
ncbi:MAG: carbon-nitrogen hydrolase [Gemmataceae bacterium]|nr:carbon-nitrogen hydrolase [Gemmataceae bacterium]